MLQILIRVNQAQLTLQEPDITGIPLETHNSSAYISLTNVYCHLFWQL